MRATLFLLIGLVVLSGCSAPIPTPSPRPSRVATPTPEPSPVVATTSPVPSASPSTTITDQVGDIRFERPTAWNTTHPGVSIDPGIFLVLSSVPLVTPCSWLASGPMACLPGAAIPNGGVLIWFATGGTAVVPAATPLPIVANDNIGCTAAGGHELTTRVWSTYIGACMRGSTADAAFLAFFRSLRRVGA
jgi:hypothetical protein